MDYSILIIVLLFRFVEDLFDNIGVLRDTQITTIFLYIRSKYLLDNIEIYFGSITSAFQIVSAPLPV